MNLDIEDYFFIELEHLNGKKIFPFNLYIFNPISKHYFAFLNANTPLTTEKLSFLNAILERGGKLSVNKKQKRTFLVDTEHDEKDIPGLKEKEISAFEITHKMNLHLLEKFKEKVPEKSFKEELNTALEQKDFTPLIERTRTEVLAFSIKKSKTVSLAIYLCDKLLHQDNMTNRIVVFAYQFAKNCDIKDEESLSTLICAAFMHHLGLTQIDRDLAFKPVISLPDDARKMYRRHPGLAQHLLRKCGIELSDRVLDIINQHHERFEGTGYPDAKKGAHIDPLALFLGVSSHIFEFSEGYINEQKMSIKSVILNIKNKTLYAGLELDFGNTIYQNLSSLISEVS